jgi:hypothetical protein
MVVSGMSDVGLITTMLAAFLLAIALVRLLGRLIDPHATGGGWADKPPDASRAGLAGPVDGTSTITDLDEPQ